MRHLLLRSLILTSAISAMPLFAQEPAPAPAAAAAPAGAAQQQQQALPVKNVVLFSSGVGYFEHFGPVKGQGVTELRFKTSQINDILKSLVLQDLDGGKVSTVQYPSQDPVEKTLASFQVDISDNPPLAQLLNKLRGAKVTVSVANEKFSGTVLGAEAREVIVKPETPPVQTWFVNLLNGASIRQIELNKVTDLNLNDPTLQDELARALAALANARDQDKKPVTISFTGEGERRIKLGYVVESPVWKTSYRLIMGDKETTLQGWAIVENQTDNDWNDVQLSLVSGRPISFEMNLYQPLYVPRPVVEMELYQSLRPRTYDEGMAEKRQAGGAPGGGKFGFDGAAKDVNEQARLRRAPMSPAPASAAEAADFSLTSQAARQNLDAAASVQSAASAAKLGELFQYTVGNVSLPRQKSAMIPIVTDKVAVEKVSIYNQAVLAKHPLNGAIVTNSTDKHLLQGPITVFEASAYAGDAQIDNVPPGQKRLLSYGIDLQVLVQTRAEGNSQVVSGKIVKGVLQVTRKNVQSMAYTAENKSDNEKNLVIEHPLNETWKLVNTPEPMEKTQTLYRFKLALPKGEQKSLTVSQELVNAQVIEILPCDVNTLLIYARQGEIPAAVRDALTEAAKRKQAMADLEREINERTKQGNAIEQEQTRLRENMKTVDKTSTYYTRLLAKLDDQENQIEKLQKESESLRLKLDEARKSLQDFVNALNVG